MTSFEERKRKKYAAFVDSLEGGREPTPLLEEYAHWLAYDDNLPWRIPPGYLVNLLDEAIERLHIGDQP